MEVMEGGGASLRHESLLVARNALHRHVGRRDRRGRVGRDRVLAVAWLAVQAARRVHEHRERDLHRRGRGREEACEGWRARRARRGRGEGRGSRAAGAAHVVLAQAIVNGLLGEGDRFAAAVVVERIRLHAARGGRLREEVCPAGGRVSKRQITRRSASRGLEPRVGARLGDEADATAQYSLLNTPKLCAIAAFTGTCDARATGEASRALGSRLRARASVPRVRMRACARGRGVASALGARLRRRVHLDGRAALGRAVQRRVLVILRTAGRGAAGGGWVRVSWRGPGRTAGGEVRTCSE